jgi:FkbM family methyltransferase
MQDYRKTLFSIVNHILLKHPEFAPEIEKLTARIQGKGWGANTVKEEIGLLAQKLGNAPMLAVDIGGNIGDYTAELRSMYNHMEIHTFEPVSVNLVKLAERFSGDSKISILPYAVSDKATAAKIYYDFPGSGLASLYKRNLDHYNMKFEGAEDINTIVFEDYWNANLARRPIDIVKIDIEGHELNALSGFGAALPVTKYIQFEFGGCNIDSRTFFRDFWDFFRDHHFKLYRMAAMGLVDVSHYSEWDECFMTTNFVAENSQIM